MMKVTKKNLMNYLDMTEKGAADVVRFVNGVSLDRYTFLEQMMEDLLRVMQQPGSFASNTRWYPYDVDSLGTDTGIAKLLYINRGDTYINTICYDVWKRKFFVGSWGEWYEDYELSEGLDNIY